MSFLHLNFSGRTTSPWHVGKRSFRDYLYTRTDYLWGRGIRGPVLRQLWRESCPKASASERVRFHPERDCVTCQKSDGCAFNDLRGSGEGEFKDRPKLIIRNLYFKETFTPRLFSLVSRKDSTRGVVQGKGPVWIEAIPPDIEFEFEAILQGDGLEHKGELIDATGTSIDFFGWGAFCNEGFGRGQIERVEENNFKSFEKKVLEPAVAGVEERRTTFKIEPVLLLEKERFNNYTSILEEGFREKLINSINERYWQFYGDNIYVPLEKVSGKGRTAEIRYWSRKQGSSGLFKGVGNELTLHYDKLDEEHIKALALMRCGIGRFKNMGMGGLIAK